MEHRAAVGYGRTARRRTRDGALAAVGALLLAAGLAVPTAAATVPPATDGVQPSDVPGFTPVTPGIQTLQNPNDRGLAQAFIQCAAGETLLGQLDTGPAATVGQLYGQGEGPFGSPALMVGSAVFTDGSTSDATQAYSALAGPTFRTCWLSTLDSITTALTTGLASLEGEPTITSLPQLALGGNVQSSGFAFHRTYSALGSTATTSTGLTAIRVGDVVAALITNGTGQTFPESLRASVAKAMAVRMGATPTAPAPSPTPPAPSPTPTESCRRARIPDPSKPVLSTAQVDGVVHAKARFAGETTNGTSTCVWALHVRPVATTAPSTYTWQMALDGPLSSKKAAADAYGAATSAAGLSVDVPGLGDHAALVQTSAGPELVLAAGTYLLRFSSATTHGPTASMVFHALATLVLARLGIDEDTGTGKGSAGGQRKHWSAGDWAGPKFCRSNYGVSVLVYTAGGERHDATFNGVAACGEAYTSSSSNLQGPIWWREGDSPSGKKLEEFDSTGYQCVEYADRYFYYMTGEQGAWTAGSDVATVLYYTYHRADPSLGLVPKPKSKVGGTRSFDPSLHAGDIISMWQANDPIGHVAVVTKVNVHKKADGRYQGYVNMINENASATGITHITVVTGRLTYDGGYFTTFQWLTGLPAS